MTIRKRSLHIGLNYPGTPAELSGCVNDALDWQLLADTLGYSTVVLTEATHDEILTTIAAMLSGLKWSDRFLFTYSGHGSWIPDRDGDEADGRDEVLCPADYESNVITDDELHQVFATAERGVRRVIISDSCHSGSVNRFAPEERSVARVARFMPPAVFLSSRATKRAQKATQAPLKRSLSRIGAALISGCSDTEYSYDAWFGDRPNGAFTRAALDVHAVLTEAGRPVTMARWHHHIRNFLPDESYPQTPQLQAQPHQRYWQL